jgi:hypothetical protein
MTDAPVPSPSADDLDGHTLDELVEYLQRGRTPFDPAIEGSPACRIALAGLERLNLLAGELLEADAAEGRADERWVDDVLGRISLESRAGRRFRFTGLGPGVTAEVTEGALRGLVRAVGDSIPGLLTGRVRFAPHDDEGVMDLEVDVHVRYGVPIEELADELRRRIAAVLPQHAPFAVGRLDVRVRDVVLPEEEAR